MGNCNCNSNNCIVPIILGIVAAIIAAIVGTTAAIVNLTGVVLVIAAVILTILLATALLRNNGRREHRENDCMCRNGTCLLIGTFGALVTGIIAFVTGLETVLLLAFLVGFLTWMLVAALILLLCLVTENCD